MSQTHMSRLHPPDPRPAGVTTSVEQLMTPKVRADGARKAAKTPRRATSLVLCGVIALATVAACGNGGGATSTSDSFKRVPQTGGPVTVWVDSTRLAAAKLYQKQHPS